MIKIVSEDDFSELRKQMKIWYKQFPEHSSNILEIENILESHIKKYSLALVGYRQSHRKHFLELAQAELDEMNRIIHMVDKFALIAMLSK